MFRCHRALNYITRRATVISPVSPLITAGSYIKPASSPLVPTNFLRLYRTKKPDPEDDSPTKTKPATAKKARRSTDDPITTPAPTNMADAHASGSLHISDLFGVKDKICVVTGGGTGIGLMIAQGLAKNGATVYITGRRKEALDKVVSEYGNKEGKIIGLQCDITKKDSIESIREVIHKHHPTGIHLLVNNAGIACEDHTRGQAPEQLNDPKAVHQWLWSADPGEWAATFETNTAGQYWTSVAFLPLLNAGTTNTPGYSSSIVNITSVSGVMKGSSSGQFAYSASKAATIHLTRMLASTFKDLKVRVNSIAPGLFPSEMTERKPADAVGKSKLEQGEREWPAGRAGDEADIAGAVIWLASPAGLFVNGQSISVDGGMTLVNPSTA